MVLLICCTALVLCSCKAKTTETNIDTETLKTQQSRELIIVNNENGVLKYRFTTPLMERYELAKEPYMEFREGIYLESYDSLKVVESHIKADYAKFDENKELWEAKGNVVAMNLKGQVLTTELLYWDQRAKKIYSPVESTITQGTDIIVGTGFESDETMQDYTFNKPKGKMSIDKVD